MPIKTSIWTLTLLFMAGLVFRLSAAAGDFLPVKVELESPKVELREVAPEELTALLEKALRQEWRVVDGDLMVEMEKTPSPVSVPLGEISLRWVTRLSQPSRRVHPQFEILVEGRPAARLAFPIRVQWLREVWVAESPLVSQSLLSSSAIKRQKMDVLGLAGTPWTGDPAVDDWTVTAPVASGGVILDRCIRKRPLLRRGETVAARLEDGFLSVEFQAVALEDGFKGGMVRLRSLLNPVELKGKVINESAVVIVR